MAGSGVLLKCIQNADFMGPGGIVTGPDLKQVAQYVQGACIPGRSLQEAQEAFLQLQLGHLLEMLETFLEPPQVKLVAQVMQGQLAQQQQLALVVLVDLVVDWLLFSLKQLQALEL